MMDETVDFLPESFRTPARLADPCGFCAHRRDEHTWRGSEAEAKAFRARCTVAVCICSVWTPGAA